MKEVAYMGSYGLILNIILTPIFIHIFDMGLMDAAWVSNIGLMLYSLVGLYLFFEEQGNICG